MLRKDNIIKHKNHMDVAVLITYCYKADDGFRVLGHWLNQGFTETYPIGIPTEFTIPEKDLNQWLLCLDPKAECIRYTKWEEIL